MPYGPVQQGTESALAAASRLVTEGGADMIKVDAAAEFPDTVRALAGAGSPVFAQFGLTPQTASKYGIPYGAQNSPAAQASATAAAKIVAEAKLLERSGGCLLDFTAHRDRLRREMARCRNRNQRQYRQSRARRLHGADRRRARRAPVCIVDGTGKIVREVKVASEPQALLAVLRNAPNCFKRIGLEAGPLSQWLYGALAEAGLPVICVGTRHMRAVLKAQINKTDCNSRLQVNLEMGLV